jgi:glycogen debranching enzyme
MTFSEPTSPAIQVLKNTIDVTQIPFSTLGSRLMLYLDSDHSTLTIQLAERLNQLQPGLEDHLSRPAFLSDLHLIDRAGTPLSIQQITTYPHALFLGTRIGPFSIAFFNEHTLAVGFPENQPGGISGLISPGVWHATPQGGELRESRNLSYRTNGTILRNILHPQTGGKQLELIVEAGQDKAVFLSVRSDLNLSTQTAPFSAVLDKAEQRWEDWFASIPAVQNDYTKKYTYAWWVLGNNLVSPKGALKRPAVMPSKAHYLGIWNWDAAFHALALRHRDISLAQDQIRALLDWQQPDGMLPDVVHDEGTVTWIAHPSAAEVTKPPVMAWTALKLHETHPDPAFLAEIYPGLVQWNRWWFSNLDDASGLPVYTHPYSSGADDNPLWDHGLPALSPDLCSYLVLQMESLGKIAQTLKKPDEASTWRSRADKLMEKTTRELYDPEKQFFAAKHQGSVIPERTLLNLSPLWTGRLSPSQQEALLQQLTDPQIFWGDFPLSTVAKDNPSFSPEVMWRGPVWVNTNYLFIEALFKIGQDQLARELRLKTIQMIQNHEDIYEYYHPQTGAPPPTAVPMFSWSAALFIDLVLQEYREDPS